MTAVSERLSEKRELLAIPELLWLADRLQIDPQLLTFFIKMTAFQPHRARHIRHVKILAVNFGQ